MKANKAPEKLYFGESDKGLLDLYSIKESDDNIEYTRTDAFIEKAVTYLEATLFNEVCYGEIRPDIVQAYINDFKKAMKL